MMYVQKKNFTHIKVIIEGVKPSKPTLLRRLKRQNLIGAIVIYTPSYYAHDS